MALEDFDIDKIDSAVNSAFGGKSTAAKPTAAKPSAAGPNLEGLNPDLAQRLQQARDAHKQRFGKDLQITSGVRSREEQQSLYNRWKAGEKGIYQPINPADYPKQKTFHSDAVDISTSVPESFLNEFGIHRPMGSKDPVHAVLMTKAPAAKTNVVEKPTPPDGIGTTVGPEIVFTERNDTGIENIDKLMNPEAINAAVDTAVKEPPKKGKVATKASSFFGDVKAGAVATGIRPWRMNHHGGVFGHLHAITRHGDQAGNGCGQSIDHHGHAGFVALHGIVNGDAICHGPAYAVDPHRDGVGVQRVQLFDKAGGADRLVIPPACANVAIDQNFSRRCRHALRGAGHRGHLANGIPLRLISGLCGLRHARKCTRLKLLIRAKLRKI